MKILYIYRHPDMGYSIGKVFHPIEEEMKKYAEVDSVFLPVSNYSLRGLWKNIRYARQHLKDKKYDIVHITGTEHYLLPFLCDVKTVITIHDLGFFTNNRLNFRNVLKYCLWIKTLPFASYVTFISDKSKNETLRFVKLKDNKNSVVLNPVGPEFVAYPKDINKLYPIILHIGIGSNKNLDSTIIALKEFPCKLRIVGKLTDKQKFLLDLYNIHYECVFNLTDDEILHEYINCDLVNFPSLYEGFGMPIIEGQAIGRLVLTSNISPTKEVAGNSAVLVNPTNPDNIRYGYKILLDNAEDYIKKGFENVKRFALSQISQEYFQIYKNVVK